MASFSGDQGLAVATGTNPTHNVGWDAHTEDFSNLAAWGIPEHEVDASGRLVPWDHGVHPFEASSRTLSRFDPTTMGPSHGFSGESSTLSPGFAHDHEAEGPGANYHASYQRPELSAAMDDDRRHASLADLVGGAVYKHMELPAAVNDERRHGSLADLVGSAMQRQDTATHASADTSPQQEHAAQKPASTTYPRKGRHVSGGLAERFPGNIRGIIEAGRPGFRKGGDRANYYETRNSPKWQSYLNHVYFDNRLQWIPLSDSEIHDLRYALRKSRAQFVLPSSVDGQPNVRIHRHLTNGKFISGIKHIDWIHPENIVISVWSGPHQVLVKGNPSSVKDRYITFFHGLGQLPYTEENAVVRHLEQFIETRPPATYVKFH